jgi:diguanylate cyclase (GGDEF)-like protein/PAS domain S-box-containing protein
MSKRLFDLIPLGQPFAEDELHLRFKIIFLNSVFLMAAVVSFGMGFYRWQHSAVMGAIDFVFSLLSFLTLYYLRRHKEKIELISTLAIAMCYVLFTAIYLLANYNSVRLSLFFLLAAAAFFLKGRHTGLRWLQLILLTIVVPYLVPGLELRFSLIDIVTTCLYLMALYVIFWNYETVREEQFAREQDHQLQKLVDERWRVAVESAGDAIWDRDFQHKKQLYSSSFARMLGYTEAELGNDSHLLERLLHPDDLSASTARMLACLHKESDGQFSAEQRLRCKDGSYKWILCRGRVSQRDAEGHALRMTGTSTDISELKRMQEVLLHSRRELEDERGLFQAILDNAPLGIWMLGPDGRLRFVNKGFCNATGISEERFLEAQHYSEVLPPAVAPSCMQSDRQCLEQSEPHTSWEWLPFVDGREHLLEITKVRLLNKDGSARGLIGLAMDVTERKEHERQLERIAHYDALTGMPNRVLLADRMKQALAHAQREQGRLAVCCLDLDGFKPVNDSFGHETGDRVLVEVTRRIKASIREDDTVARLGGDEFVVLLVGLQAAEECVTSLNRLLSMIRQPIEAGGHLINLSASIGVALYPEDEQDADTLLRHADQSMYLAKQAGKNRYHLFDPESDLRARSHHELLQQIRHGLMHGEFELYYQPKVEMANGRLIGAEALIRWNHPTRGLLPPGEFLRQIENTELDIELGDWVIVNAIDQLRRWRADGFLPEVSINVSAYHLQSPGFTDHLRTQADLCCPGNCYGTLQVEILETAALDDIKGVSAIIAECKAFGMFFALDDFGTGYSSLTYLSSLDVDTLKVDQSFVRHMLENKGDQAIVQGIIALASAFGRRTVAEGVETEAHYRALREMGCEAAQGYHIARPMPAPALLEWAKHRQVS